MTVPIEPPPDDNPIDPNPSYPYPGPQSAYPGYPGPPWAGRYLPPGAPAPPPPGYPGSYPPPWDTGRPGGISAASVLAYINAGLLILAGLLLLAGSSAVDSWNDAFGSHDNHIAAELAVDGLVNLLSAGLQIAGGVMIADRSARGRILLTVGGGLCVAAGVYWLIRVHAASVAIWTIVFIALPVIGMSLAWTAPCTQWLRKEQAQPHS
jgi:hypothetical protein